MVSLGLLVLRVIIGGIMVVHGYPKVFGGAGKGDTVSPETERMLGAGFKQAMEHGGVENTTGLMQNLGLPYPKTMAMGLAGTELVGGIALILGWFTRPAALALTVSQLVAIQKVHGPAGLVNSGEQGSGYEFNAALIAGTATLALAGPGALAAD